MTSFESRGIAGPAIGAAILAVLVASCMSEAPSPLDRYVGAVDDAYRWEHVGGPQPAGNATLHELRLVSQEWNGGEWSHTLRVVVPDELARSPTMVLLLIAGSADGDDELLFGGLIASAIGAPVAVLHDVPNQPLLGGLREDALIAETFVRFLETGDEEWPLLLPMVKSAVSAMDAVEEFVESELDTSVSGFVVTGGSKRGWTTWLTAAVDSRVRAIAPIAYDNLDLVGQTNHQDQAWGQLSEQISDYTERGIADRLTSGDKMARKLAEIVDPFEYRDRITVPKLMIVGANDRYWPLDAMNLYYDELVGERYIQYVPNAGHGLDVGLLNAVADVIAFFLKTDGRLSFPSLAWEFREEPGHVNLTVTSDVTPAQVRVWTARSATRDFRGSTWEAVEVARADGAYAYRLDTSGEGFAAMFGEAVYGEGGSQFYLSTNVRIY